MKPEGYYEASFWCDINEFKYDQGKKVTFIYLYNYLILNYY